MDKNNNDQNPEHIKRERSSFYKGIRRVILAGIGAMAIAQEELENFIDRLVERGEIAEQEGRDLIQEIRERREKEREQAREKVNERIEETLERMNVPTKKDIDTLNEKLTNLTKKVEELRETQ